MKKKSGTFNALDAIALTLDQPKGWAGVLLKTAAVGGAAAITYVVVKAANAELTSITEHRDARRMANGITECGDLYKIRRIVDEDENRKLLSIVTLSISDDEKS